jgi:hypothetical protein
VLGAAARRLAQAYGVGRRTGTQHCRLAPAGESIKKPGPLSIYPNHEALKHVFECSGGFMAQARSRQLATLRASRNQAPGPSIPTMKPDAAETDARVSALMEIIMESPRKMWTPSDRRYGRENGHGFCSRISCRW